MKYHLARSTVINAPLKKVRSLVSDFKEWNRWSPWSILEPNHASTVTGMAGAVGHKMTWNGEGIGSGSNAIEGLEGDSILYDLKFFKPFKSQAKTRFDFKKVEGGTKVTWSMDSSMPFFLFFMVKTMKSWIEMDYDRGLAMLKAIAEAGKVDAKTTDEGVGEFKGFEWIGIEKTSTMDKMPEEMTACFKKLMKFFKDKEKKAQHWVTIYPKVNIKTKTFTYIAAASSEELEGVDLPKEFKRGEIKSGTMFQIKHRGSYRFLGNAWSMGMMAIRGKKMKQRGFPFEYYWNNPHEVKESELETSIYFPVK